MSRMAPAPTCMATLSGNFRIEAPSAFCEPPTSFFTSQPFVAPSEQSNTPLVSTSVPSFFFVGISV